jgi:hypothetical protein
MRKYKELPAHLNIPRPKATTMPVGVQAKMMPLVHGNRI